MPVTKRVTLQDLELGQLPVLDWTTTPPGSIIEGRRYLIAVGGTGAWSGHDNEIATGTASDSWDFTVPDYGMITFVDDVGYHVYYTTGDSWETWADIDDLDDVADGDTYGRVKNTELAGGKASTGQVRRLRVTFDIVGVNTTNDTFDVAGDQTDVFADGDVFTVFGSTGNDGSWTIDTGGVSYSNSTKKTTITVTGDVTDATVDGYLFNTTDPLYVTGEEARDAYDRRAIYNPARAALEFAVDDIA